MTKKGKRKAEIMKELLNVEEALSSKIGCSYSEIHGKSHKTGYKLDFYLYGEDRDNLIKWVNECYEKHLLLKFSERKRELEEELKSLLLEEELKSLL